MTRTLPVLAAVLLGVCASRPAAAASRQLELRITYRAAAGCPAADVFLARLNEHVGYGGNNYLEGSVVVVPAEQGYRLFLQFNGGRLDEIEGASCAALVDEAVRTAGLARTDSPVQTAEAQLQRALELGSARDGWTTPPGIATEAPPASAPAPAAPALEQDRLEPAAVEEDPGSSWSSHLLGQAQYVSGALPAPALGGGLVLATTYGELQGRLELSLWPSQPWAFLSGPRAAEVELRTGSAALGLCSRLLTVALTAGALQLDGCVRGAFVRLESLASDDYEAGAAHYGTLGSRLGVAWAYSGLRIELQGGLDVARGEPALGPDAGNRFVAESAQLAASLAIGWQFGGGRAE